MMRYSRSVAYRIIGDRIRAVLRDHTCSHGKKIIQTVNLKRGHVLSVNVENNLQTVQSMCVCGGGYL
jgi:hypothetical protein